MNYILEQIQEISVTITMIVTLASSVTALTNTPPKTSFQGKLYKIIELLALVTDKTKQK
jgi:hypothetical protein